MRRFAIGLVACVVGAAGCGRPATPPAEQQAGGAAPASPAAQVTPATSVYMCPMDKNIRAHSPGNCPICGMKLVTSVPEPVEYHLDLSAASTPRPNIPVRLTFHVLDPWKDLPVAKFSVVHEKLFHAFIVSRDLEVFLHGHPSWHEGAFEYDLTLPKSGMYRVLGDFYPEASTPQLIAKTLFVAGPDQQPPSLGRDYSTKSGDNLQVGLATSPESPSAGLPTRLLLSVSPSDGIERYLGVWAHMLAASDDLIDMMHTHPTLADGGSSMQFDVVFPRARPYRVWVQIQRRGVVNTVHFDVPVKPAPKDEEGAP